VPLSFPQEINGAIDRDAVEPDAKIGASLKGFQLLVHSQERFLNNFLGIDLVSRHTVSQADGCGCAAPRAPERPRDLPLELAQQPQPGSLPS
jgi:hypothetical protein